MALMALMAWTGSWADLLNTMLCSKAMSKDSRRPRYSTISSLNDVQSCLSEACIKLEDAEGLNLLYRGQADATWDLLPGAARFYSSLQHEQGATRRFKMKAQSRHSTLPPTEDWAAWLFVMQHYGHPTRLLDWTESFLAALYFCVENPQHREKDGAVWTLNSVRLNATTQQNVGQRQQQTQAAISLPFARSEAQDSQLLKAAAIAPQESDLRMLVQQAGFTIHGGWPIDPLNGIDDCEKFLWKFVVPSAKKEELYKILYRLGVRRSTLFPDLGNLAQEIKSLKMSMEGHNK